VTQVATMLLRTSRVYSTATNRLHWCGASLLLFTPLNSSLYVSEHSMQLQQWKAFNTIRVICSVSAWIG
jgi:hypothetical protein